MSSVPLKRASKKADDCSADEQEACIFNHIRELPIVTS